MYYAQEWEFRMLTRTISLVSVVFNKIIRAGKLSIVRAGTSERKHMATDETRVGRISRLYPRG